MNNIRNLKLDAETRALVNALGNKLVELCEQQELAQHLGHFQLGIAGPDWIFFDKGFSESCAPPLVSPLKEERR